MNQLRLRVLAAVVLGAMLITGCTKSGEQGGESAADATIKIGEFASLTGKEAVFRPVFAQGHAAGH